MIPPRLITAEERAALLPARGEIIVSPIKADGTTPVSPPNQVRWHKKGCTTCGPKIFNTRQV